MLNIEVVQGIPPPLTLPPRPTVPPVILDSTLGGEILPPPEELAHVLGENLPLALDFERQPGCRPMSKLPRKQRTTHIGTTAFVENVHTCGRYNESTHDPHTSHHNTPTPTIPHRALLPSLPFSLPSLFPFPPFSPSLPLL